jgi:hypothetical protein
MKMDSDFWTQKHKSKETLLNGRMAGEGTLYKPSRRVCHLDVKTDARNWYNETEPGKKTFAN